MGSVSLFTVAVIWAVGSFLCLCWMMWNLIVVTRRDGLSNTVGKRASQTKEILLKPTLVFFALGIIAATVFALGVGAISQ